MPHRHSGFGAEGIGLCRTEHMFFEGDRIKAFREMILADDEAGRRVALAKLLPIQRGDFEGLFKAMNGFPVTVRLLDPPLHEFVPHDEKGQKEMAREMDVPLQKIVAKVGVAGRVQPHAGTPRLPPGQHLPRDHRDAGTRHHRGGHECPCAGHPVHVEIMVPLVATTRNCATRKASSTRRPNRYSSERNDKIDYMVGTMIEVPPAQP